MSAFPLASLLQGTSFVVTATRAPDPSEFLPWSIDETYERFLEEGLLKDDARILHKQDVDGQTLPELNDESLFRIGIPTFGRRCRVLRVVRKIIEQATTQKYDLKKETHYERDSQRKLAVETEKKNKTNDRTAEQSVADCNVDSNRLQKKQEHKQKMDSKNTVIRSSGHSDQTSNQPVLQQATSNKHVDVEQKELISNNNAQQSDNDSEVERTSVYSRKRNAENHEVENIPSSGSGDEKLLASGNAAHASEFMAVIPWLGSIVAPSTPPQNDPNVPSHQLKLDWVYGYRAFESRSNLVCNDNGDIVYPVAGICVVYNVKNRTQQHFLGHDNDVCCLAQHPKNLNIIASGQDSTIIEGQSTPSYICVWDSTDFTKMSRLNMEKSDRAVRSVAFSSDGRFLASISNDDHYTVKVWEWEKKELLASSLGDSNRIMQVRWSNRVPNEFVTVGKRHAVFWSWDLKSRKLTSKRALLGSNLVTFFAAAYSEKGYACLGADNGSIFVFHQEKIAKIFKSVHAGKVYTLESYPGGLVSGGSDKTVCILDKRMDVIKHFSFSHKISSVYTRGNNLLIGTQGAEVFEISQFPDTTICDDKHLEPITAGHSDGELWAMAVAPDNKHFVTAGEDNLICIWDIPNKRLVKREVIDTKADKSPNIRMASTMSTHPANQCARGIAISPNGKHIIVGLNNGNVKVVNSTDLSNIQTIDLNAHSKRQITKQTGNWIQVMQYSPSGRTVAVGTHGSVICLLDVADAYKVKGVITSHNAAVLHLDWSEDGTFLQSTCLSYELLFHEIDENALNGARQITNPMLVRDVKWHTQTCPFGWPVQGVFSHSQNGQDIDTVDANPSKTLIVTGDDMGKVNLYRYPSLKDAKFISYEGHSSFVTTTRFTLDEKMVISTGGHDLAIFVWKLV